MIIRRSAILKYFLAVLIGGVLYAEWFVFTIQPLYWNILECSDNDPTCTKMLFVADPQIQGDMAVPPPLNYIFNFDSDRFLKSTFSVAANILKPDIIVYLGDIMDEGSIASLKQFHAYVKRISDIFDLSYTVKTVWIPGDNDIGGEGNEPVDRKKLEEFEKVFLSSTSTIHVPERNISLFKVNAITKEYSINPADYKNENYFRIVVSHYPVTSTNQMFTSLLHQKIHPHVYFCAHQHISKYRKSRKSDLSFKETTYLKDNTIIDLLTDDFIYEVYVPTCSYRMGTNEMGFGVAILDQNNTRMRYTVYWSPKRFPFLIMYLLFSAVLCLYCIVYFVGKLWLLRKVSQLSQQRYNKVPLSDAV